VQDVHEEVAPAQKYHGGGEAEDGADYCIFIDAPCESNDTTIICFELLFVPDHNHDDRGNTISVKLMHGSNDQSE